MSQPALTKVSTSSRLTASTAILRSGAAVWRGKWPQAHPGKTPDADQKSERSQKARCGAPQRRPPRAAANESVLVPGKCLCVTITWQSGLTACARSRHGGRPPGNAAAVFHNVLRCFINRMNGPCRPFGGKHGLSGLVQPCSFFLPRDPEPDPLKQKRRPVDTENKAILFRSARCFKPVSKTDGLFPAGGKRVSFGRSSDQPQLPLCFG